MNTGQEYLHFICRFPLSVLLYLCTFIWLTGLSCPDFQAGGSTSASWSKAPFPMRSGRVGRGCRALSITHHPAEARSEVSWHLLALSQRAQSPNSFVQAVFFSTVYLYKEHYEVSCRCLHLSQAAKDSGPEHILSSIKFSKWVQSCLSVVRAAFKP